jgi:hypothetical protein
MAATSVNGAATEGVYAEGPIEDKENAGAHDTEQQQRQPEAFTTPGQKQLETPRAGHDGQNAQLHTLQDPKSQQLHGIPIDSDTNGSKVCHKIF